MFSSERILNVLIILFLLFALAGCGTGEKEEPPDLPVGVNLLENPSFEEWDGKVPVGWELRYFEGDGEVEQRYGKSTKEKVTGKFSFFLRGLFSTDKWYILTQRHQVAPGYAVNFSAMMTSLNIKRNKDQQARANIFIRFLDKNGEPLQDRYYNDAATGYLSGTLPWRRFRLKKDAPEKARFVECGLINQMTGHLYFDDLEFVLERTRRWIKTETKYVSFYHLEGHPFPEGAVDAEAGMVRDIVRRLGLKVEKKIKYYYYPSEEELQKAMGVKRGHQRSNWAKGELHTMSAAEDHEILHHLMYYLGYPPVGLVEGLIFSLQGDPEGRDPHAVSKEHLIQMKISPLYKTLSREGLVACSVSVIMPAWTSFCKFLIEREGIKKFMELYERTEGIDESEPFNVHFKDIYGEDFDVVDRRWRLFLMRYQPEAVEGGGK